MKAIVKPGRGPGLHVMEVPRPQVGARDVLIKVAVASICGSDVPVYEWSDPWVRSTVQPGQIIGHEFCGTVVEIGDQVQGYKPGDFVTAEGHVSCGLCAQCLCGEGHICPNLRLIGFDMPGGFAEFISVPERNVIRLNHISHDIACILDPFGNAVHAVSDVKLTNSSVLITGCGPLGLMALILCREAGARKIVATDVSPYRLALARNLGATLALSAAEADTAQMLTGLDTENGGVDVLLEMSGSPSAYDQGFRALRNGGQAVLMGLPKGPFAFDFANEIVTKGVGVQGVTGRRMFATWYEALKLVDNQESLVSTHLSELVTHHVEMEDIEYGLQLMQSGQCGKVVVRIDPSIAAN